MRGECDEPTAGVSEPKLCRQSGMPTLCKQRKGWATRGFLTRSRSKVWNRNGRPGAPSLRSLQVWDSAVASGLGFSKPPKLEQSQRRRTRVSALHEQRRGAEGCSGSHPSKIAKGGAASAVETQGWGSPPANLRGQQFRADCLPPFRKEHERVGHPLPWCWQDGQSAFSTASAPSMFT